MQIRLLFKKFVYRLRGEYTVETLVKMGMTVGKNFSPQLDVYLDPSHCWLITIGNDVTIAPRAQVLAHDASTCHYLGHAKIGRVDIGNRVFIGAGSIILPGVSIGDDVIIGAGSVVTGSVESNSVYAGNPAKFVCHTNEYIAKHSQNMDSRPVYTDAYTLRKNIDCTKKEQQKNALGDGIGYVE